MDIKNPPQSLICKCFLGGKTLQRYTLKSKCQRKTPNNYSSREQTQSFTGFLNFVSSIQKLRIMKTKEFYIEKAKELIEKAKLVKGEYDENDIFSYPEMKDPSRELIHLIYSYDKTLPLLDEAKELMELSFSGISFDNHKCKVDFQKYHTICKYFIHYIEELAPERAVHS